MTIKYENFAGIIYDVDDTLLDNHPGGSRYNLHEQSRFAAILAIADEMGITALNGLTEDENERAFSEAITHTVDAAIWNLMCKRGIVSAELPIDLNHKILTAIVDKKAELHMAMLLEKGVEVPGAADFVKARHIHLPNLQNIASGARHEEIEVFFNKYGIHEIIPRDIRIARGDYEKSKPHPESFNKAFERLKLPDTADVRRRTIVFEDDPKGIESAIAGGFTVVGLTTRFPESVLMSYEQRPLLTIPNFLEADRIFS
jgi:beta-phosphoglucomutase-like phosphatase (HAD superfamily)